MFDSEDSLIYKSNQILREEGLEEFVRRSGNYVRLKLATENLKKVRQKLGCTYYTQVQNWYKIKNEFDIDRYCAPLNVYKVIWISPDKITHVTGRPIHVPEERRFEQFGMVKSGEWDQTESLSILPWKPDKFGDNRWLVELLLANEFEDSVFYQSLERHFNEDVKWNQTRFYKAVMKGLKEEKPPHPYARDQDKFMRTLDKIDSLYRSIEKYGLSPHCEKSDEPFLKMMAGSILVDISRDGEFMFVEGRRRLAVAKILGIEKIPVSVLVRHEDWMEQRDRIYRNNLHSVHPDLQEIQ